MGHFSEDPSTLQYQVVIQPNLGLDANSRKSIIDLLNVTLSDEILLATKTRNLYWNVHGTAFFELRALLDGQYQRLCCLSDEMAERVRMLGGFAFGSLQVFLEYTRLSEQPGDVPDVLRLLADHEAIIRFLREDANRCINEFEDEGTKALLVSAMCAHEKIAWMLRSSIQIENSHP